MNRPAIDGKTLRLASGQGSTDRAPQPAMWAGTCGWQTEVSGAPRGHGRGDSVGVVVAKVGRSRAPATGKDNANISGGEQSWRTTAGAVLRLQVLLRPSAALAWKRCGPGAGPVPPRPNAADLPALAPACGRTGLTFVHVDGCVGSVQNGSVVGGYRCG